MGESLDNIIQQGMPGTAEGHPAGPPEPDAARVRVLRKERDEAAAEPKPAGEEVDLANDLKQTLEAPDGDKEEGA